MKRCARRSFDEAVSSVLVNRQDHQAPTVGPCKTCSHPQREFLEVFEVSAWLCAGATIVHCLLEICSVNSRFPPFASSFVR